MQPGLGREEVDAEILSVLSKSDQNMFIEDKNSRFKSGRGPVGIVIIKLVGTVMTPSVVFFKWATAMNKLRSCVRFFVKMRHDRQVSAVVVKCYDDSINLFHRVKDCGVILYVGKIAGGNPSGVGAEYIFSTQGMYGK